MILNWNKPKKIMGTKGWQQISADGCPPGVYTPNMSEDDMFKWKAKLIKGKNPRVEIRKSFQKQNGKQYPDGRNIYSQSLIIVTLHDNDDMKDCNILFSANGKSGMSFNEFEELNLVVKEAVEVLNLI